MAIASTANTQFVKDAKNVIEDIADQHYEPRESFKPQDVQKCFICEDAQAVHRAKHMYEAPWVQMLQRHGVQ